MFINLLSTNFNRYFINQIVSNLVTPTDVSTSHSWQSNLEINFMDKITISRNSATYLATKIYSTVKGLFNRFNCKVCMSSIYNFEKSNLRITCKVNILLKSILISLLGVEYTLRIFRYG